MNRILKKFQELKKIRKTAFMPFLVAGDPNFKTSLKISRLLIRHADFLEVGSPYSDPLADGPVIQAANNRALQSGMNTDRVFQFVKSIRKFSSIPITILVYANLVYQREIEKFYLDAKRAGVDGVLIPDLPIEEARAYLLAAKQNRICPIFMVTQTTTRRRLSKILRVAEGYLYLITVLGTTGERKNLPPQTISLIRQVKRQAALPVCTGFGISTRQQISLLKEAGADGFIVGSALIKTIEKNLRQKNRLYSELERYVISLT